MAENSFFLNILNLIISIGILIEAYKKNNIILFFYIFVFQVLVIGQAINISYNLQDSDYVMYFNNFITDLGHLYASYMLFIIIIIIWIFTHLFSKKNIFYIKSSEYHRYEINKNNKIFLPIYYIVHIFLLILGVIILINTIGGINVIFEESRPGNITNGVTLCLLIITFGLYPLFFKCICKIKKNIFDIILFCLSYCILLTFSRMLACIHLLIFYIVYFYIKRCDMKKEIPRLCIILLLLFFIMVLYGAYRHSLLFDVNSIWELNEIDPDNSLLSIDLFYRIGIEGMSGFSGAVTQMISDNEFFCMDFGISSILSIGIDIFPSYIKEIIFYDKADVSTIYWYSGHSIISGGLENFIVHFSIFSILLYPMIFSGITLYSDYLLKKSNNILKMTLLIIIISFGIMLIRGTIPLMLFYILYESLVYIFSEKLFTIFYSKI